MNRTLVICKPDAVERGLVGELVGRLERKGLRLVAAQLRQIDEATASEHYEEHRGKPFYPDLVGFITRSPSMAFTVRTRRPSSKRMRSPTRTSPASPW